MEMEKLKFVRPKCVGGQSVPTPHLYVANCGPALGLSLETIATAFGIFGTVASVNTADETGTRVIVTYHGIAPAEAAKESWDGYPCSYFGGRVLHLQYSVPCAPCKVEGTLRVFTVASEMGIPGLYLIPNFISKQEEHKLLAAVDERPWQGLLKRRVQHYGYEFMYKTRNVDREQNLGQLPLFLSDLLNRISSLPEVNQAENYLPLDQLTVNEYPPGVGLSPHIDTHSAFDGCIISLSLAGPCIMEFRKYTSVGWVSSKENDADHGQLDVDMSCTEDNLGNQCSTKCPKFERMALFLPPRSLLLLSEDARYAWHHYIPHHKVDIVNGERIPRSLRRVSFTFRSIWPLQL
ncbi:alkylated DNA repair protein ALKBH8 homolog isoform X2 [Cryptomeria japonica]|uniref:alkylated DNA repair protein ALKBH8 homolog isoform X2 n=1 Tax=Cryptomeria japonica TaxID=3369 RepID=UPI0025ABD2EF|nr:alkylated DNA repair protein ALKBH8 homolog isoform X2 [Cryptomeria japonica]